LKKISIFLLFFSLAFFSLAQALELPSLDKPKVRMSIAPGETAYGELVIENRSGESRTMRCYLEDWRYSAGGDGTKDFFPPSTNVLSCASWISFSPADFTIQPYGRKKISYSIKVPEGAQGGYYAVLFFESNFGGQGAGAGEENVGGEIGLAIRIGTLFYVEIKGNASRRASLENLSFTQTKGSGLAILLSLNNTGNVDITSATTYHIMDKNGLIHARGEFNEAYTLPGDNVRLAAAWDEPIPSGKYTLVVTSDIGKGLEDTNSGRGPVIVKEALIQIGDYGEVASVGELR